MNESAKSDLYPPESSEREDFHLLLNATLISSPSSSGLLSIFEIRA